MLCVIIDKSYNNDTWSLKIEQQKFRTPTWYEEYEAKCEGISLKQTLKLKK